MVTRQLIEQFFDMYRRYCEVVFGTGGPTVLARGTDAVSGYEALEHEIGRQLPRSFKLWHSLYSTDEILIGGLSLPPSPASDPLAALRKEILESGISDEAIAVGIIPFGYSDDLGAYLCFDASEPVSDDEWPIIYIDHETSFAHAIRDARRGPSMSFSELLSGTIEAMENILSYYAERGDFVS